MAKGRNPQLVNARDIRLSARFYFYSTIVGLNFSKCTDLLILEFDLSESRLTDLLAENAGLISKFTYNNISVKQLSSAYPFMVWKYAHSEMSETANALLLDLAS